MAVNVIPGSVLQNIKRIGGADERINTREEAKAFLEYMPKADVRCGEDNIRLYNAYQTAQNILKYGEDTNLGKDIVKLFHKAKEQGKILLANISDRISSWSKTLASL